MSKLRLQLHYHGTIRHGRCVLCARPYELVSTGWALRFNTRCRGYVCLTCIEMGPRRTAHRLRRRATHHRLVAGKLSPHLPALLGEAFCRQRFDFADCLDSIADEMSGLTDWPVAV
jgi:hypothetical protein